MKANRLIFWMFPLLMLVLITGADAKTAKGKPALVLQITIDQMRGDFPMRYKDRLGKGGLQYLMQQGTHYTNAHFRHADTETPVGHAALFTGTYPAHNGIVAGNWFDKDKGRVIYNCEDDRYPLIGKKPAQGEGRAPTNILSSTIGDELMLSNNSRSRMFSVSIKDRGAILPGGHTGKAFWYSKGDGSFVSSSYYYKTYPDWVTKWNGEKHADTYKDKAWELLHDPSTYVFGKDDDRPFEVDMFGLGTTFPHPVKGNAPHFYASLIATPFGDELTADFAKTLIKEEKLGKGPHTDFLAVSFSVTDYIGHLFGPSSLEAEDNILRIDKLLADLFRYVDEQVGLDRTLIILSSDHGMCEAPEYMASLGFEVGRLTSATIVKDTLAKALKERLNVPETVIRLYEHPYVYLNEDEIGKTEYSVARVEATLAEEITRIPGIIGALTRTDLLKGAVAPTRTNMTILNNFHGKRSGNIHVIADQFWYFYYEMDTTTDIAAIHCSPWTYDTYVPLFFAGYGIPAQRIARPVTPYDIAPTLASLLEIKPPSGSVGIPLDEVLHQNASGENWVTASRTALPSAAK
ncbi:alkaline phosphatase family protein [Desulfoluna spongiiphila]|uniref:alkaline phosphatase family protein n=1 Tax=Desulfoluna spongiiphila TaxID=419481 RepID=UPI00125695BC|nr:alkaline phosphatase family protein [Desulfoluna spongiiphila]VVS91591.1 alkaline phosphatase prokaryotic [Desulfoluna spongiiphila]